MAADPSSYRLSEQDSHRIFANEILPAEFHNLPQQQQQHHGTQQQPLAVLVVGQTGAGKTRLSPAIMSALPLARGGSPTAHLIADTYKTYHPQYTRLMLSSPELASPATGPDARAWLAMASEEVTRRHLDVLLESACRHPRDFVDLVRIFAAAAYRVEVVLLAVPAALSRLGILVRFYEKLPESQSRNLPVRLTPGKVHDDSYAGLVDAAKFLDEEALADQVVIVRRGNLVAHGAVKASDGTLGNGQGHDGSSLAAALVEERQRPLTQLEMKLALNDIQKLTTHEDASEPLRAVRELLQPLLEDKNSPRDGKRIWPDLKPLDFMGTRNGTGSAYNVLRLGRPL